MNDGGVPFRLCLHDPFEANGVMFCGITADYETTISVLDIDPAIRHCTASK